MKITVPNTYPRIEGVHITEAIALECDGGGYDTGAVEAAARTAENVSKMLGRLVNILAEKKLLTAQDISMIIYYGFDRDITLSE